MEDKNGIYTVKPYKYDEDMLNMRISNGPYIKFCMYLQCVPEAREGGFINVDEVLEEAASCYMLLDEVLLVLVRLDVRSEGKKLI